MSSPLVKYFVLPGGFPPVLGMRSGDVAYDIRLRAIVSTREDPKFPYMRETLWDLKNDPPPDFQKDALWKGRWIYRLQPKQKVRLGVGLVLGGDSHNWYASTLRRTGAILKEIEFEKEADQPKEVLPPHAIHRTEDSIWDPNYRGEGMVFLKNDSEDQAIEITHGWDPVQLIFRCNCCAPSGFLRPELQQVSTHGELGGSARGTQWNNSSNSRYIQPEFRIPTLSVVGK
jgi:hypothetical protein